MTTERPTKQWYALQIVINREVEEAISSALWEEGTLGIVTAAETPAQLTLLSYFDRALNPGELRAQLTTALSCYDYAPDNLQDISITEVPDEDWLKKWKEGYQPFNVGARFRITPSWARDEQVEPTRIVIEIDPGMAFGTGTHETTRLCLEAIERYWQGGRLLDVGTGTGILAIGAIKFQPASVVKACDNDPEAVQVARENLEINRVADQIELTVGSAADYRSGNFDLLVANLTADVIIPLMADLIACVAPQGRLILSGILDTQRDSVAESLAAHNQRILEVNQAGEWVAFVSESN